MLSRDEFDLICRINGKTIAGQLQKRLTEMREQIMAEVMAAVKSLPPPAAGEKGEKGDSVDPAVVEAMVAKAVDALPKAKDGADGKSVDPEEVRALVAAAVAEIPSPKDGKDGKDAEPVDTGPIIAEIESRCVELVNGHAELTSKSVTERVENFLAAIPVPKDGRDADPVDHALVAAELEKMLAGKVAEWMLGYERKADEWFRRWLDALPKPKDGADGKDGLGLKDFDVEQSGDGRTVILRLADESVQKEFALSFPVVIDRGVFKTGQEYEAGDGVTWAGSFWIAKEKTAVRPGDGSEWRLAVKKGRDGRDGKDGEKGEAGKPGRDGKDFRGF